MVDETGPSSSSSSSIDKKRKRIADSDFESHLGNVNSLSDDDELLSLGIMSLLPYLFLNITFIKILGPNFVFVFFEIETLICL